MRKTLALLALLSLLAPLTVFAAPAATASVKLSPVDVGQLLSPQELTAAAAPVAELDNLFQSMSSGSSIGGTPSILHLCSISCAVCTGFGACPSGQGTCGLSCGVTH
jgi:hypothetical protein